MKNNIPHSYSFHPKLVLRTPQRSMSTNLIKNAVVTDKAFLESLYLASPVLTDEIAKLSNDTSNDKKILLSLNKYLLRSATRCTPFGLFSGCSVAEWSTDKTAVQINQDEIKRHSRLDMHYACALAQHLATLLFVKPYLNYYPNNSLYLIGDELRYVEYKYDNGRRKHQISSVFHSDYLELLLKEAANGIRIDTMKRLLITDDISEEDAADFINELLDAQILVSELEPAITGDEFLHQIMKSMKEIYAENASAELEKIIETLEAVNNLINKIDKQQVNHPDDYMPILHLLKELGIPFELNKLFQTDAIKITDNAVVNNDLQKEILEAIEVLNRLSSDQHPSNITSFATRFTSRYENKEIPLLEVLDTETGLGYPEKSGDDTTPLVDNLVLPQIKETNANIQWGLIENWLNEKLNDAHRNNQLSIALTDADLSQLKASNWNDLPASMSVMFRLMDGPQNVYLESVSGSSAANLLGRFAHADEAINTLVKEITKSEQDNNQEVIFAEIVHLPESRIGNILLHPQFRQYEIPYLATSSVTQDYQIALSDLMVSVSNQQVILRSKKLNKIIVPRLSTAHNYSLSALPVYQFLCDLQHQGKRSGLYFSWGSLAARFHFLPRITYKKVMLSPATWRFSQKFYKILLESSGTALYENMENFRKEWQLPALLVLAEGDNELLINLDDHLSVDMLIDAIKNKPGIELKEFLSPDTQAVKDRNAQFYCNQFVASLIKNGSSYKTAQFPQPERLNTVVRSFAPGSNWLYYKLYCGAKSADKILSEAILPLTMQLKETGLVEQFFFIRYNDPGFHIRLRFQLSKTSDLGKTMEFFHNKLHDFELRGFTWKIQLDTYQRELERYGWNTIEIAEKIFHYDSVAVLKMLDLTSGDAREDIRWLWAIRAIDSLLNDFEFSIDQKLALTEHLKSSFMEEFKADKLLKNQLNKKYNDNRKLIEFTMDTTNDASSDIQPLLQILVEKSMSMQPLALSLIAMQKNNTMEITLPNLLNSFIHMLVNRTVLAKPRLHELVIYDMLYRYYFSIKARNKNKNAEVILSDISVQYQPVLAIG